MKSTCTVHQQTPYSTPYSTVVCEDSEYSRVHSEYIDDTLEYYVLCKVRRVQAEYTQVHWSTMYSAWSTVYSARSTVYSVRSTVYSARSTVYSARCAPPTPPPPSTHLSSLPSAPSCQPSAVRTQHSPLSKHSAPIRGAAAASRGARRPSPNTPSTGRAGAASPSPTRASLPCWSRPCACPSSARRSPSASPPSRCS